MHPIVFNRLSSMLSIQERKQLNIDFFTALGRVMQGCFSETGKRMQWTNYRTGIRGIYVRIELEKKGVSFNVDLEIKDPDIKEMMWEQMLELKAVLASEIPAELTWNEDFVKPTGISVGRIQCRCGTGTIYNKGTWPEMLAFLKESLLGFDRFWAICFDIFKALEE